MNKNLQERLDEIRTPLWFKLLMVFAALFWLTALFAVVLSIVWLAKHVI